MTDQLPSIAASLSLPAAGAGVEEVAALGVQPKPKSAIKATRMDRSNDLLEELAYILEHMMTVISRV